MKTTLVLPDPLFRRLKQRAAEAGRTLSSLVEELLTKGLAGDTSPKKPLPHLPTLDGGRILVDVSDRNAIDQALDRERDERLYARPQRPAKNVRR